MAKTNFKRQKGGKEKWGIGLDYLFKEYWNEIDDLVRDNYFGRHNPKLINPLFSKISVALDKSIAEMEAFCRKDSPGLKEWVIKVRKIQKLAKSSKSLNEKVIFIDTAIQFLRATSIRDRKKAVEKKIIIRNGVVQLKGLVVSCAGKKIRGVAKIVLNKKDFSKIKEGGILITKETSPDFLPTMKKAAAFVADFGGLLCHMAIVARELKKPCIVNTKISTSVFKDGDLIEMDAKQGIVKIIKKAG
ncbi:hypothetical protein HY798_05190 [Candidatus Falkowbacteria bacterium]|nr:hypothetical protein [Candidatus Falkowbacteria bacterium]